MSTPGAGRYAGRYAGLASVANMIDALSDGVGRTVSWLTLFMVLVTFLVVVLRYVFDLGWIWMQELTTWMHALVFLLGAAYTLRAGEHVRVDVFYRRFSPAGRARIDIAGVLTLLVPTCGYILWVATPYVVTSWMQHEGSRETGGLPFPFVPLAKSSIVLMASLLLLQGIAMALRAGLVISGRLDARVAGYATEVTPGREL